MNARKRTGRTSKSVPVNPAQKLKTIGTGILLCVLAIIVGFIAYKQIFLSSRIIAALPESAFTQGLQSCIQNNYSPAMLQSTLGQTSLKSDFNFDFQGIFGSVWEQVSGSVVPTLIEKNHLSGIKVLKIADLFGNQADIRINGTVDLVSSMPMMGSVNTQKDYEALLIKRNDSYHINGLSVKNTDSQQWDKWQCVQSL